MGFHLQDISEFNMIPNAAQGEIYSCIPCRMVHSAFCITLKLWNLFRCTTNGSTRCFRHVLLLKWHSKKVVEQQTKIKQVKCQLKTIVFDSEFSLVKQQAAWITLPGFQSF